MVSSFNGVPPAGRSSLQYELSMKPCVFVVKRRGSCIGKIPAAGYTQV